jgi:hypothetical protein
VSGYSCGNTRDAYGILMAKPLKKRLHGRLRRYQNDIEPSQGDRV